MTKEEFNVIKENFLSKQFEHKNYKELNEIKCFKIKCGNTVNDNLVKIAIRRAYEDSQPRTIKKHSSEGLFKWDDEKNPMGYLFEQLESFFVNNFAEEKEFIKWHSGICGAFLDRYNDFLIEKECAIQCIGKAQKIINMALKYLYCMTDEEDENRFRYCHMPLDQYTFKNWVYRKVNELEKIKVLKKEVESWSNIEVYSSEDEKEHTYIWFQQRIQDYLNDKERNKVYIIDDKEMTPLQAEFIIWEEEKIRETLLLVMNLTLVDDEKIKYNNDELEKLIKEAEQKIINLKKRYNIQKN